MKKYDVVIALRTYTGSKGPKPRAIYPKNKYKMVEVCLKSLKASLGSLKVKMIALLDSCPLEWRDLFKRFFDKNDLLIINLEKAGEVGSIKKAIDLLIKQKYSEIVYMAEDDYYYLPNQFEKMVDFIRNNPEVDFITPYDHIDYYKYNLHDYKSKIKIYAGKHWRTVGTTCNTFLSTKKKFYAIKDIFLKSYTSKNIFNKSYIINNSFLKKLFWNLLQLPPDNSVWLSITKSNLFKPLKILKYRIYYRQIYDTYFRAWRFNWKQILFGKKWNLWCPIPSIATHLDSAYLAPNFDWYNLFQNELKEQQKNKETN